MDGVQASGEKQSLERDRERSIVRELAMWSQASVDTVGRTPEND